MSMFIAFFPMNFTNHFRKFLPYFQLYIMKIPFHIIAVKISCPWILVSGCDPWWLETSFQLSCGPMFNVLVSIFASDP